MDKKLENLYVCPFTKRKLSLKAGKLSGGLTPYRIHRGIPDFVLKDRLTTLEADTQKEYDLVADQTYDAAVDWLFASFHENEDSVREGMVDKLNLTRESRVLEIGCGTGRDSFRIARRLSKNGVFFVQDLSPRMVEKTKDLLSEPYRKEHGIACEINCFISNATNLPFADRCFDAVFHFGGFNNFGDPKAALAEFCRITKKGGKIVVGDESLPPWLEGTTFGEIIYTNNALFRHKVPLAALPACAREVTLRWVLGGCFYLIDFVVGEGDPPIDLDLPHKGRRGGTMRTRYYGQLEGVTLEAKKLAIEAAKKKGQSLHGWLDDLVKRGAKRDIGA